MAGAYEKELSVRFDLAGLEQFKTKFNAILSEIGVGATGGDESFGAGQLLRNFEQAIASIRAQFETLAPQLAASIDETFAPLLARLRAPIITGSFAGSPEFDPRLANIARFQEGYKNVDARLSAQQQFPGVIQPPPPPVGGVPVAGGVPDPAQDPRSRAAMQARIDSAVRVATATQNEADALGADASETRRARIALAQQVATAMVDEVDIIKTSAAEGKVQRSEEIRSRIALAGAVAKAMVEEADTIASDAAEVKVQSAEQTRQRIRLASEVATAMVDEKAAIVAAVTEQKVQRSEEVRNRIALAQSVATAMVEEANAITAEAAEVKVQRAEEVRNRIALAGQVAAAMVEEADAITAAAAEGKVQRAEELRQRIAAAEQVATAMVEEADAIVAAGAEEKVQRKEEINLRIRQSAEVAAAMVEETDAITTAAAEAKVQRKEEITQRILLAQEVATAMVEEADAIALNTSLENAASKEAVNARIAAAGRIAAAATAAEEQIAGQGAAGTGGAGALGGAGLLGSAKTLIPLVAGFTAYSQIRSALKDAQDLEKVLAITRVEMTDLGKGAEFGQFKQGIIEIATSTGSMSSEVAQAAQLFQAAFGGDTVRALNETNSAMQTVKVTGLSMSNVVNDFLALDKSFESTGVTVDQLTSTALGLQERFGTLAKDTIEFAALLAPIGAEAGFTAKDLEALGAAYQEFSGKPASAGAEQIGRVLGGIQDKAVQLIQFLQTAAPGISQAVAQSISSGDIKGAFELLLSNYDKLSTGQQQQLLVTIAGRREAATLAAVFDDNAKLLDELNGKYDDSGKLQTTFIEVQKTLVQQIQELGAAVRNVGLDFYNSGLKEFLSTLATEVGAVVGAFDKLASVFDIVDHATGGLAADLASILFTLKAIQVVANSQLFLKLLGGIGLGGVGPVAAAGAAGGAGLAETTGLAALLTKFNPITGIRAGVGTALEVGAGDAAAGTIGLGLGSSIGAGFSAAMAAAGPGLILLGGLAADKIIGSFSSGVQGSIDTKIRADLGGKLTVDNPADIDKILKGHNVGGFGIDNSQQLGLFLSHVPEGFGRKPSDVLSDAVNKHASEYQQILDDLPGPTRSENIDEMRQRARQAEDALGQNVKTNLELLDSNAQVLGEFLKDDKSKFFGDGATTDSAKAKIEGYIQSLDKAGGKYENLSPDDQRKYADLFNLFRPGGPLSQAGATVDQKMKALADKAAQQEIDINDAASAKSEFESGMIGLGEYLGRLSSAQKALDALAQSGSPADVKAADKARAEQTKVTSDALRQQTDLTVNAQQIAGHDDPKIQVDALTQLLNNPDFSDKSDRLQATKDLVNAIKKEKAYEASLATTATEKSAILNSVSTLPPAAQQALLEEFLNSSINFQTFLQTTLNGRVELEKDITTIVAQELANGEKDVRTAIIDADKIKLAILYQVLGDLQKMSPYIRDPKAIDKIVADINAVTAEYIAAVNGTGPDTTIPDFSKVGGDDSSAAAAKVQAVQAEHARRNAELDVQVANAKGDAVTLASIAQQRAQLDAEFAVTDAEKAEARARIIDADHQAAQAALEHNSLLRDLQVAQSGDDPIQAAQKAIDDANAIINDPLSGKDDVLKAQAALARAQKHMADVIRSSFDAQFDLLIAIDNFNGDAVKAAQDSLAKLVARLNDPNLKLSDTEKTQLEGQIKNASLQVAETQISQGEQDINTQLELGKINKQQAIAELQALKGFAVNQKEIDQIDLEIKRLKGQLGQDFKFNIPTVLGLPTLYEARRLGQSGASGAGYQDNRIINVIVNANTNASPQDIANAVTSVMGAPQTFGITGRRY